MHDAKLFATVSVGENASPLPLLSIGASVIISQSDWKCIDEVRKPHK